VATSPLGEQEFVAHLFAPLDGPNVDLALQQVGDLWKACRTQLGMTQRIVGTGLPAEFPADPRAGPERALAGLQDPAVSFQVIVRREHDALNLSLAMAAPEAPPRRQHTVGSAIPPGWYEFARWWRTLTTGGLGALLGGATIYLAKSPDGAETDVRAHLPPHEDDASAWWASAILIDGFPTWDVTSGGDRAIRRLVVLGRPDEDARLSQHTWSAGDIALPPLGRYLMHAAKLRHQVRVLGDGSELTRLRERATARMDRLVGLLRNPDAAADVAAAVAEVAADEAELAGTLEALHRMRRSVEIARGNMASALPDPFPSDAALAGRVSQQLVDDVDFLEGVRVRAERTREITRTPVQVPPVTTAIPEPPPEQPPRLDTRVVQRLGFGFDVIGYSSRSSPQQAEVQQRLAGMVERVLLGIGLELHDTDRQDAGDGMVVVLPPDLELHRVLPGLLRGWRIQVLAGNGEHPGDRIRLRLSVAAGPFANAAIGFAGATIIEIGRLLDSAALRRAAADHHDADVVALISDRLYADVVGEGHPGLDPDQFVRIPVEVKTYQKEAWLWTGAALSAHSPEPAAPAPATQGHGGRSDRDVFVIHGSHDRARAALFGFLRALGLHPLEWDEIIARTGNPAPYRQEVLEQAFVDNQAAIVLVTTEDGAPGNVSVLLEAGMALALQPERTIIVELGGARPFAGLGGRNNVRIDGTSSTALHQLAQRLRIAGCAVNTAGSDWMNPDRFAGL
jgi:hypothetical protein